MLDEIVKPPEQPRDERTGKYLPKRPLEFTWPHFWLEVTEVALAILIAQVIWEGGAWFIKL